MRFYTLEEKKPEYREKILAKIYSKEEGFYYYVVCRTNRPVYVEGEWKDKDIYEEAMGEQYAYWEKERIIGWTSFDEIEKAEKWKIKIKNECI